MQRVPLLFPQGCRNRTMPASAALFPPKRRLSEHQLFPRRAKFRFRSAPIARLLFRVRHHWARIPRIQYTFLSRSAAMTLRQVFFRLNPALVRFPGEVRCSAKHQHNRFCRAPHRLRAIDGKRFPADSPHLLPFPQPES